MKITKEIRTQHRASFRKKLLGTRWPNKRVYRYTVLCSCGSTTSVNGSSREAHLVHRDHLASVAKDW